MARVEGLGRSWVWPDSDRECLKVIFNWISDLDRVVRFCKQRRTAIQAGGNMGVWPWRLAQSFKEVNTAEPDPECADLMAENLRDTPNVRIHQVAFMDREGFCRMQPDGVANRGAQYIVQEEGAPICCTTIDSLNIVDCDLIYLDIEGAELKALQGAVETIRRSYPVIAYEDKNLGQRFGSSKYDTEKWLAKEFGYEVVARYHNDVVLTCAS